MPFLGIFIGILMVVKPDKVLNLLGRSAIAERLDERGFLTGGSISWYQIVGIVLIVISFLSFFGLTQRMIFWFFSPFFGSQTPVE